MKNYGNKKATEFTAKQIGVVYGLAKNGDLMVEKWFMSYLYDMANFYGYDDNGDTEKEEAYVLKMLEGVFAKNYKQAQEEIDALTSHLLKLFSNKKLGSLDRNLVGGFAKEEVEMVNETEGENDMKEIREEIAKAFNELRRVYSRTVNEDFEKKLTEAIIGLQKHNDYNKDVSDLSEDELVAYAHPHLTKSEVKQVIKEGLVFSLPDVRQLVLWLEDYFDDDDFEDYAVDVIKEVDAVGNMYVVDIR